MGLLKSLPFRLPRLSGPSLTVYKLTVRAGDNEPHVLALLDGDDLEETMILSNANRFRMPDPPIFEKVDYAGVEIRGRLTPVIIAEARAEADGFEPVDLPDGLGGKRIPEVERSDEELQELA